MYYYIEGNLTYKDANLAVIDCGGVGYKLIISYTTYSRLPELKSKTKLFTHLVVKEDALDLLGFYDLSGKSAYLMLTSVSGIGEKVAMSVLTSLTPERFAFAVASGDYKELAIAQGVSTKTGQKIILELRDKIAKEDISKKSATESFAAPDSGMVAGAGVRSDAINALMVLQYSRTEANNALKDADFSKPLEDIIKAALRNLSRN
jgi:Holliday junction DNA helicase RuvA